jgi:hypothetical protein
MSHRNCEIKNRQGFTEIYGLLLRVSKYGPTTVNGPRGADPGRSLYWIGRSRNHIEMLQFIEAQKERWLNVREAQPLFCDSRQRPSPAKRQSPNQEKGRMILNYA